MPIAKLESVVLDCPDPGVLAAFYAGLLGGTPEVEEDWIDLRKWPAPDASQQFHLDVTVADLDTAEREVLALGAKPLDTEDRARSFRVYADPAGHPFCLCAG